MIPFRNLCRMAAPGEPSSSARGLLRRDATAGLPRRLSVCSGRPCARSLSETGTRASWRTVPRQSYVIPDRDVSITELIAEEMAARADTAYRAQDTMPVHIRTLSVADLLDG